MKNINLIIFFLISLFIFSCDDVEVINPETTYKEYIVVRGELKSLSSFDGVAFTKTLPISEAYDTNKAYIKSAIAYLKIDGLKIIPLHYYAKGYYKPNEYITIFPGQTYELFATVDNTSIYATTKIPENPKVVSALYANNHIDADVKSNPSEVYGAVWMLIDPGNSNVLDMASDFLSIVNSQYEYSLFSTPVRTMDMPETYSSSSYKDYRYLEVYAFDAPYLEYFNTKGNNDPVSNAFVQGGDQIVWNVKGNKVIGLFIGVSEGNRIKVN